MTPELIRELATEIVNQTIWNNWLFYVVLGLLVIVASAGGNYISSYFSKRAENKAMAADFDELKRQLKESTSVTESIKADIQRLSDRSEKLEWLKREKLEDYVIAILRGAEYLSQVMRHHYFNAESPPEEDPMVLALTLQRLYLPELDEPHKDLLRAVSSFKEWLAKGMVEQSEAMQAEGGKRPPTSVHLDQYKEQVEMLNMVTLKVEHAARDLSRELNKV